MSVRINSYDLVHKSRVFKMVRENVTLDNGVTVDIDLIHHPGASAIVPFLDPETLVLIRQYRHAVRKYIWEIPAGTLDPAENPLECASRELVEETGFEADTWEKLGEIIPVPSYSDERIHIFMAKDLKADRQHLDMDEVLDVHQVKVTDALKMIEQGDIQDAKSITGIFLALRRMKAPDFCT